MVAWKNPPEIPGDWRAQALLVNELLDRINNELDASKGLTAEHVVGKLDIELLFQSQHQANCCQRGQPGVIQITGILELIDRARKSTVLGENIANLICVHLKSYHWSRPELATWSRHLTSGKAALPAK